MSEDNKKLELEEIIAKQTGSVSCEDDAGSGNTTSTIDNQNNKDTNVNNEKKKNNKKKKKKRRKGCCCFGVGMKNVVSETIPNEQKHSVDRNPNSSSCRTSDDGGGGGLLCWKGKLGVMGSTSPVSSQTSDPNDPEFNFDMLRNLIETNDFYSKQCNPHIELP